MQRYVVAAFLVPLLGCQPDLGPNCVGLGRAAIAVEVHDHASGTPVYAETKLFVRSGAHRDSAFALVGYQPELPRLGAGDIAGTYDVLVTNPAYQDWFVSGISVTRGTCTLNTVFLQASLRAK